MSQNLKLSAQGSWITVDDRYTFKVEGYVVHKGDVAIPVEERKAAARRIVVCVNACEGVDTETLEQSISRDGVIAIFRTELAEIAKRAAQRDGLLAALEKALSFLEEYAVEIDDEMGTGRSLAELERDGDLPPRVIAVREAIARVKGGAS